MSRQETQKPRKKPSLAQQLGAELRRHRQLKGLSLSDVAERLKLPVRQIDALENGAYAVLPEPVFIRGFLRSYGRFLDLDEEQLGHYIDQLSPSMQQMVANKQKHALNFTNSKIKKPFPKWIFGVLIAGAIGAGIYYWQEQANANNAEVENKTATLSPVVAKVTEAPELENANVLVKPMTTPDTATVASDAVAPATEPELVIKTRYRSALTVTNAKGKVLINQVVAPNSKHIFQEDSPYEVRVGYAVGASVTFDGQPVEINLKKNEKTATLNIGRSPSAQAVSVPVPPAN